MTIKEYKPISGLSAALNTGLPRVSVTPEGTALAGIPGWSLLVSPDFAQDDATATSGRAFARNRVTGVDLISDALVKDITFDEFANGEKAFGYGVNAPRLASDVSFTPSEWSFVFAFTQNVDGVDSAVARSGDLTGTGKILIQIASVSKVVLRENATDVIAASDVLTEGVPHVAVVTYSGDEGYKIHVDGDLQGTNDTAAAVSGGYEAGDWYLFRDLEAKVGLTGLLSIDLSKPENAAYRDIITDFLMEKYGVS